MEETKEAINTDHKEVVTEWLLGGLQELYNDGRHCDTEVVVEGRPFKCHKVILSAASRYFDAMFSSGMKESANQKIFLKGMKAETFQKALEFVYYGQNVITEENVEDLLQAAAMMQIKCLQEQCERFLVDILSTENCIGLWIAAKMYNCEIILQSVWPYILRNFDNVWETEEFAKLEIKDLKALICDDELHVSSEEIVCRAVLRWYQSDEDFRQECLTQLFPMLQLTAMPLDFLLDEVDTVPVISNDPDCRTRLKEAIRYHALPDRRQTFQTSDTSFRKTSEFRGLFALVGRRNTEWGDSRTEMIGYCSREKKWFYLCSLPFDLGDDFATCTYGNDMFISGGTAKPRVLMRYSAKLHQWKRRTEMAHGRYRHSFVAVGDSLFALGGYNMGTLSSIEEFDLTTETWQKVGELKIAVDAASASVANGKIYIFGGWLGFAEDATAIQCFDTRSRVCTVVNHLPSPCRYSRAFMSNKKTYIVYPTGEVVMHSPSKEVKIVEVIGDFNRKNFSLYKHGNTMYIIGGELVDVEEKEEPKLTNQIVAVPMNAGKTKGDFLPDTLPEAVEVYGCFKTTIRAKYPLTEYDQAVI